MIRKHSHEAYCKITNFGSLRVQPRRIKINAMKYGKIVLQYHTAL